MLLRGYLLGLWVETASHFLAGALNHQDETLQGFLSLLPQTRSVGKMVWNYSEGQVFALSTPAWTADFGFSVVFQSSPRELSYLPVNYLLLKKAKAGATLLHCKSFHVSFQSRSRIQFWFLPWNVSTRSLYFTYLLLLPDLSLSWYGNLSLLFPSLRCLRIWTWKGVFFPICLLVSHPLLLSVTDRAPQKLSYHHHPWCKDQPITEPHTSPWPSCWRCPVVYMNR